MLMAREFAPPQIPSQRIISRHGTTQPQPQPRPPRALSTIAISASHISKKPISLSKRTPARAAKVFSHPRLRSFPSRLDTTTATFHCPSLSPSSFLSLLLRQSLSAAMSNIQFLKLLVEVILIVLNILARDEAFGSLASFAQTRQYCFKLAAELLWADIPATAIIWCTLVDKSLHPESAADKEIVAGCKFENQKERGSSDSFDAWRVLTVRHISSAAFRGRSSDCAY